MKILGIPPLAEVPAPWPGLRLWRALVGSVRGTLGLLVGDA